MTLGFTGATTVQPVPKHGDAVSLRRVPGRLVAARMGDRAALMPPSGSDVASGPDQLSSDQRH